MQLPFEHFGILVWQTTFGILQILYTDITKFLQPNKPRKSCSMVVARPTMQLVDNKVNLPRKVLIRNIQKHLNLDQTLDREFWLVI